MIRVAISLCVIVAAKSGPAFAGSESVQYAKAPPWVVAAPTSTEGASPPDAPIRVVHLDYQVHSGPNGDELFIAQRARIQKPEALAAGNVTLTWSPEAGDATVHYLRIIRDGKAIDVLESAKFQVLRREEFLESAALNGQLTAVLQVPGLQVGDELEYAATVRRKDLTLGEHSFGYLQLPMTGMPGAFRIRVVWPESRPLTLQASKDLPAPREGRHGGEKELTYELRDPKAVIVADGAPQRVNVRRLVEYSDFKSWQEVSARLWPLFSKASELPADSPIRQEISRVAASTTDPVERAQAALELVQDRIRYVYVGLDGGNFRPAATDETWTRRFGDCKAKTALLMAMLRELGIQSEPVLAQLRGGDGIEDRLPSPGVFDHVLVRATIGGAVYWLDGTRIGDKSLAALPPPIYRWVLPLRNGGADLEAIARTVPQVPQLINVIEVDASGGFDARAPLGAHLILRGDDAQKLRAVLAGMSTEDADRAIRGYWTKMGSWIAPDVGSWAYDEKGSVLRLSVKGTTKLDWEGNDTAGRTLDIMGAGFTPPAEYRRPKEQDQTAPWATEYPSYRCWATAIRLPKSTARWQWDYRANPVHMTMGGVTYWRAADLRDGVVRTVMSRRFDEPEISASEAQQVNEELPTFDNKISQVFQVDANRLPAMHAVQAKPPFEEDTDWMSAAAPCGEAH
jgi:uncharacterized protein DUF3857/transglutaminase superfamily protein